jgi:hypothetical protein
MRVDKKNVITAKLEHILKVYALEDGLTPNKQIEIEKVINRLYKILNREKKSMKTLENIQHSMNMDDNVNHNK